MLDLVFVVAVVVKTAGGTSTGLCACYIEQLLANSLQDGTRAGDTSWPTHDGCRTASMAVAKE